MKSDYANRLRMIDFLRAYFSTDNFCKQKVLFFYETSFSEIGRCLTKSQMSQKWHENDQCFKLSIFSITFFIWGCGDWYFRYFDRNGLANSKFDARKLGFVENLLYNNRNTKRIQISYVEVEKSRIQKLYWFCRARIFGWFAPSDVIPYVLSRNWLKIYETWLRQSIWNGWIPASLILQAKIHVNRQFIFLVGE